MKIDYSVKRQFIQFIVFVLPRISIERSQSCFNDETNYQLKAKIEFRTVVWKRKKWFVGNYHSFSIHPLFDHRTRWKRDVQVASKQRGTCAAYSRLFVAITHFPSISPSRRAVITSLSYTQTRIDWKWKVTTRRSFLPRQLCGCVKCPRRRRRRTIAIIPPARDIHTYNGK